MAEVASTCNESLLMHYMLEHCEDENERKYLITHFLDGFRTTLFRQAQFAEFEHIAHRKMQKGEPVTKDVLNELWHELNVQYYGPDMRVDDEISYEWMRIPHFTHRTMYISTRQAIRQQLLFQKRYLRRESLLWISI